MNLRSPTTAAAPDAVSGPVPAIGWLRDYRLETFRADAIAGLTLAAYLVPSAIGDASLARLPPQAGLYAALFPGLVFWIFCSSRRTAITATSALSLLLGTSLGVLAQGDVSRFASMAAWTALMTGALSFLAWMLKAGVIVNFVSESVMAGFKTGVALYIASSQLPKLCGLNSVPHGNFWEQAWFFAQRTTHVNLAAFGLGLAALALLISGSMLKRNIPISLFVVIAGILIGANRWSADNGIQLLGAVPPGLPAVGLPRLDSMQQFNDLLPLAVACFFLAAVETVAVGRTVLRRGESRLDANQEFLALSGANVLAGLTGAFPVSGGMSQSMVNTTAGARTPISTLVSAVLVLCMAALFSGLLRTLPQPVVAAVVLVAIGGLFKFRTMKRIWHVSRAEFTVATAALLGVLFSGLLLGVLIGAVISLVMMLGRVTRPHVAFLGRIPRTQRYSDMARHPDNEPVPGCLLFRVESNILYFNAEYVRATVMDKVRMMTASSRSNRMDADSPLQTMLNIENTGKRPPPLVVVCDLSTSASVDMHGAHMLGELADELAEQGIPFQVVEAHGSVRDLLRVSGLEGKVGTISRKISLADAMEALQGHGAPEPRPESQDL